MHTYQKPLLGQLFEVGSMRIYPVCENKYHEPFFTLLTKEVEFPPWEIMLKLFFSSSMTVLADTTRNPIMGLAIDWLLSIGRKI